MNSLLINGIYKYVPYSNMPCTMSGKHYWPVLHPSSAKTIAITNPTFLTKPLLWNGYLVLSLNEGFDCLYLCRNRLCVFTVILSYHLLYFRPTSHVCAYISSSNALPTNCVWCCNRKGKSYFKGEITDPDLPSPPSTAWGLVWDSELLPSPPPWGKQFVTPHKLTFVKASSFPPR